MGRYGTFYASFYTRDDLGTPLEDTQDPTVNYRVPIRGRGRWVRNGSGTGEAEFALDSYISDLIQVGRICTLYQYDALTQIYIAIAPAFTIEKVVPITSRTGDTVVISGPGLTDELKSLPRFQPVGTVTTTSSTLSARVPGPSTTTIRTGNPAPANAKRIVVTSVQDFAEGDQLTIRLTNTNDFVTLVEAVEPDGVSGAVDLRDRLPSAAAAGNNVTRKARRLPVASNTEAFQVGIEVEVPKPTDGSKFDFFSIVDEAPGNDIITVRDPVPLELASGLTIKAVSRAGATTSDVTQIMEAATSSEWLPGAWTIAFETGTGTATGTHHAPSGDSIYELLLATAEQTNEFFRPHNYAGGYPARTLVWRRTADNSNVRLVAPSPTLHSDTTEGILDASTGAVRVDRALITGQVQREGTWSLVTRVYPFAGDDRIDILKAGAAAVTSVTNRGYTIVNPTAIYNQLYGKPYLCSETREAVETNGVIARVETFSDIKVKTDNAIEIVAASDQLLLRAAAFLDERNGPRYTYQVDGVIGARPILPGQRVELVYTDPAGAWSVSRTSTNALYCIEVENVVEPVSAAGDALTGGYRVMNLVLSEDPYGRTTPERQAAKTLSTASRQARETAGAASRSSGTIIGGGGTAPDTLTATTENATTAVGHTHRIVSTSDATSLSGVGQLLKADSAGSVQVNELKARYIQLSNAAGAIEGEEATVRLYRRIEDGITYLVSERIEG